MNPKRPVARRHSRRLALQVLYAADLSRASSEESDVGEAFDRVALHFDLPEGARAFAKELVNGVVTHRAEIEARLTTHASNWRIDRMAVVDRNVLRLAVYELSHTDAPHSVVINEAIELARDFGTDRSPAFVNGVLDAVSRALSAERGAGE